MGRWARKPVNHTSWVAVVTPTDRPKSVRIRCLIELFCGVVCVVTLPFWHFCWCRGFCHRTESDLFLFLLRKFAKRVLLLFYYIFYFPKDEPFQPYHNNKFYISKINSVIRVGMAPSMWNIKRDFYEDVYTILYSRTLKTPVIYRLYGEQKAVYNNSEFNNLCDKCVNIHVY